MASIFKALLISSFLVLVLAQLSNVDGKRRPRFRPQKWQKGIATFYDPGDGTGRAGNCGYRGTTYNFKYQLTAVSDDLFKGGQGCGACYQIRCIGNAKTCVRGRKPITVTATDRCGDGYKHFDLATPAFGQIIKYEVGKVAVDYRRIPCPRPGGIRFTMDADGNPFFNMVTVWNVGGSGEVTGLQVKVHDNPKWLPFRRNWGQKWTSEARLFGKSLSFRVFASDRRSSTSWNVAPRGWQFGQTFEGKNFR